MPKSGEHRVNGIDSFFRVRPSSQNIREGESVSFLEDGKLIKQEKRNGVVYEQVFVEQQKTKQEAVQTTGDVTNLIVGGSSGDADITGITAGTGLSGGGATGNITLNIDSTVTTLTGSQTLTNKTLTSPVINTGVSGTAILDENDMSSDSDTKLATQQSIKAYVDSEISGIAAPANATITLSPGAGIGSIGDFTTNQSSNETLTIAVDGVLEDLDTLGAASSNGQFIVATGSGAFQYESGSTARTSLGLGTLATLSSISDSQVASDASIAITKLAESSITVADGSSSTAISLGNTITFSGTSNEVTVGESSGTITVGLPDDVVIANSLVVNGTTTTIDTTNLIVEDPLIKLAKANNAADSVDIGFYGLYDTSGTDKYAGLFRDANDSGKFKLFKDLQDEPTTTVDVAGTGYAKATLVADLEGNVTGNVTGNAGTATKLANARDIELTGDITGVTPGAGFDGSAAVTITTSLANDSVDLGTHTTGNYVATLTAGNLIDLQNNSGEGATPTIDVDLSELNTSTSDGDGDFFAVVDSSNAQKKLTKGNINLSGFNNDSGFTSNAGTVTSITVTGGNGLTGGGSAITSSGTVTLAVGSDTLSVGADKVDIALSALTAVSEVQGSDGFIFFDGSDSDNARAGTVSDLPFTNNSGTVTNVVAGAGLTGGGTTSATLDVGAGTGISVATNSVSTNDSEILPDNLSGFAANEHIDHSVVAITAGNGLTGGGTIASTRTLAVGAGDGITVNANDVEVDFSGLALLNTDSEPLTSQDTVVVYNQSADAIVQLSVDDIGGGAVSAVANGANDGIATFTSSDAIRGEANLTFDGTNLRLPGDNLPMTFGAGNDLKIHHSGSNSFIAQTSGATGHLYIDNNVDDKDIIFRTDDGSGGVTPYLTLDGSATQTLFHQNTRLQADQKSLSVGADNDLRMIHDTHSYLQNTTATMMVIQNTGQDQDIAFMANDNGSNNHVMRIQGATGRVGIGTTSPGRTLQVNGDGIVRLVNDSGDPGIDFNSSDMQLRYRSASDKLQFYSYGTSTNVATIQKSNGFLGLGTESPTSLLTTSGGDIRILGSNNRLRFNTNGSIYWDSSVGVKLENASSEDITIETNTSGDIFFNTGNTRAMSIQTGNKVFVGSNVQNQSLAFGGTLKTHQYLDTRDYMQHKGHFAESDWIVMESGQDHVVTSYFDNTNIYVDGV